MWSKAEASRRSSTKGAPLPDQLSTSRTTLKDKKGKRFTFDGVFSQVSIPKGAFIGEYRGKRISVKESEKYPYNAYYFDVDSSDDFGNKTGFPKHVIDACNPANSSFLRYINAANNESQQNVEFQQHGIQVFAVATRPIKPNQELLTWYGKETAEINNTATGTCPAWPHRIINFFD